MAGAFLFSSLLKIIKVRCCFHGATYLLVVGFSEGTVVLYVFVLISPV